MSLLLGSQSLSKSFGRRLLFNGISISFDDEDRTGLIGPNGSGKSTLLKIIAGLEQPDDGQLTMRRQLRLGYVPQEDTFPSARSVLQIVIEALSDQSLDEHQRLTRATTLLGKMGFENVEQSVESLSGGWKKRLSIARQLVTEPDLLLLDEPTNHLDIEGIVWLEKLLQNASFSFLLVSHDRYFLENTTNRIVELNRAYADGYLSVKGSYSEFLDRREEYLSAQAAREQAVASRVRREIEWLRRGAKARTTKAKGRIQEAGKMMEELAALKSRNAQSGPAQIDFSATDRKTRKLLVSRDVSKSLGDRLLIEHLNVVLSPGMKLGLLGRNGSGKSTLIRMMAGQLSPDSGEVWRADGLKIVLFDQNRQQLDPSQTLREALCPTGQTVSFQGSSMHVSGFAKKFLFTTEQLDLPVGQLSGGEQARVLIARLMLMPADLLILDEPTNDLDIDSLEVLEESLQDFPGALVLVTHDRFMLERIGTELLWLDGRGGSGRYTDLSQWQAAQEAAAKDARATSSAKPPSPAAKPSGPKKLTYMEQRELEQMEAKIMEAEESLHALQRQMEDPVILADRNKLHDVCTHVDAAQKNVTSLYQRWEQLEMRR
ncbi:MAG TPA: ABC-F family ATP-binding cassette domain-containing protein [Tepidisphaeraceae bacterium]|nr:ABC-F family ATP-binding cassette domain-containing protein [Tepidisphaeraceae bacterium]